MILDDETYTLEQFQKLPEPTDGSRLELADGKIVIWSGFSYQHGIVSTNTLFAVSGYVRQQRLGAALTGVGYVYKPNTLRIPDIGFISTARRSQIADEDVPVPFAPDLTVEVVSPTDTAYEMSDKIEEYRAYGVRLIWQIFPPTRLVYIYHPDSPVPAVVGEDGELDGEDVIPGFRVKVRALFETDI